MDLSEYKRGGKVRRKKAIKQKQKQKQNVKQSVVVKIGGDALKKRRPYKPRTKREIMQPYLNISSTPIQQDQNKYTELKEQLKSLQREKQNEIIKKSEPIKEEEKKIKEVREQQQREYSQQIKQAEKPKMVEQGTQKNIKIKKAEQGTQTIEKSKENKKLESVRKRQQREYSQKIKRPERAIEQSEVLVANPQTTLQSPEVTPIEKYINAMEPGSIAETIETNRKLKLSRQPVQNILEGIVATQRGRPRSNIAYEERKKKYAETARLKRENERKQMDDAIAKAQLEQRPKQNPRFKISDRPVQEISSSVGQSGYEQALGGEERGDY
jgi:hypothetical protein